MEAVECGAAALGAVLGYFGRYVPLEVLRLECGVSRDGSKASNILKVARRYGLAAKGYRRLASTVLDEGPFPSIVFWRSNHFLAVEGASGERVFLNDPASGRKTVSRDDFAAAYSGIVLTFERSDDFEPGGMPPDLFERLRDEARAYRSSLLTVISIGALIAIPGFVAPGLTSLFVDDVLVKGLSGWLVPLLLALALMIVVQGTLAWLRESTLLRLQTAMSLRRSTDFIWHVLRLPVMFFNLRYLGDVAKRVTSAERLSQLLTTDLGAAGINAVTAGLIFLSMALIDPLLALIALAGVSLNVVVVKSLERTRGEHALRLQADQGKLYATAVVGLKTLETLKATGSEDDFFRKWAGYHARAMNTEQRIARFDRIAAVSPGLIVTLTTAVVLYVGGFRVSDGLLTIGALLAYQALFATVTTPIQQIVNASGKGQQAVADLARLDDVFDYSLDWRHASKPIDAAERPPGAGGLRIEGLSFGYNPVEPPIIDGFSLKAAPGSWVALVGPSGSGKSTIGKLISGLYAPWEGEVLLDGKPLRSYDRHRLACLTATVSQEITLFEGRVRENLTLWDPLVSQEDLVRAAEDADILDFIESLAGNFEARIEERGRNLSGGQRQRIEIARGLVRNPALMVLDEATSALDPTTELNVLRALRRRGIACVLVAHRLSTIRDADEIVVLDRGRVAERGSHEELLDAGGTYARLIAEGETA